MKIEKKAVKLTAVQKMVLQDVDWIHYDGHKCYFNSSKTKNGKKYISDKIISKLLTLGLIERTNQPISPLRKVK